VKLVCAYNHTWGKTVQVEEVVRRARFDSISSESNLEKE